MTKFSRFGAPGALTTLLTSGQYYYYATFGPTLQLCAHGEAEPFTTLLELRKIHGSVLIRRRLNCGHCLVMGPLVLR